MLRTFFEFFLLMFSTVHGICVGFKMCLLSGNTEWAAAVAELAGKVYSEQGEYERVLADAISRLGQPCRDGGAEASQWLHCLAVTSLLLERIMSLRQLAGCAIESQEIVDALLLPAVSTSTICLFVYFLLEFTVCPTSHKSGAFVTFSALLLYFAILSAIHCCYCGSLYCTESLELITYGASLSGKACTP